jgi:hypothetical protein
VDRQSRKNRYIKYIELGSFLERRTIPVLKSAEVFNPGLDSGLNGVLRRCITLSKAYNGEALKKVQCFTC